MKWQLQIWIYCMFNKIKTTYMGKKGWRGEICNVCASLYCCDIMCVYVGELGLHRSCPSFQLGIPTWMIVHCTFLCTFQVQWNRQCYWQCILNFDPFAPTVYPSCVCHSVKWAVICQWGVICLSSLGFVNIRATSSDVCDGSSEAQRIVGQKS